MSYLRSVQLLLSRDSLSRACDVASILQRGRIAQSGDASSAALLDGFQENFVPPLHPLGLFFRSERQLGSSGTKGTIRETANSGAFWITHSNLPCLMRACPRVCCRGGSLTSWTVSKILPYQFLSFKTAQIDSSLSVEHHKSVAHLVSANPARRWSSSSGRTCWGFSILMSARNVSVLPGLD